MKQTDERETPKIETDTSNRFLDSDTQYLGFLNYNSEESSPSNICGATFGNHKLISLRALAMLSEAWQTFSVDNKPKSPRMVPGALFLGSVAPSIFLVDDTTSRPCQIIATTEPTPAYTTTTSLCADPLHFIFQPDDMKSSRAGKNAAFLCSS
jgi:hypothetical protein